MEKETGLHARNGTAVTHTVAMGNLLSTDTSTLYLDANSGFDASRPITVFTVVTTRLGNAVTFKEVNPSPTLSNFSVPAKVLGNASFALTAPQSNSDGAFTYSSSNLAVATISGTTVTIVGAGTTTITATQTATATYGSNSITATFTVIPLATLSNFSVPSKIFGDAPFALTAPVSNSTGAFTYTSSNLAVATISGSTVAVVGAGTTTITATQAATATHGSNSITSTFTVSSASANANASYTVLTLTTNNSTYNDDLVVAQNINNSYQTLTGDDSKVTVVLQNPFLFNNINYNTVYINSNGTIGFNTASNTSTYNATSSAASTMAAFFLPWSDTLTNKFYYKEDVISKTFTLIYDNVYWGSSTPCKSGIKLFLDNSGIAIINFGAIGSSANTSLLGFSFGSSIQSNLITTSLDGIFVPLQSPLITITNTQANYANKQIVISSSEIIISYFSVPTKLLGDAPFDLTAPVSKSDGAFTYTSSNPAVATISGSTVTIVGVGTTTITATQAATTTYASNSITATFTVTKLYTVVTTNNSTYNDDLVVAQNINNSYQTLTGDDSKVTVVLQNPFLFNNINYNTVYINSNGTIGFNTASNTSTYNATSSAASTMAAFFLPWSDTLTNKFYYKEDVISKTFTLIYDNVYWGSSTPCKSGIKLFLDNSGIAIINFGAIGSSANTSLLGFSFGSSIQSNLITTSLDGIFVPLQSPLITITNTQANYANKQIVIFTTSPTLSNFSVPSKLLGDAPFALTAPVSNSDGAFTYTSSNLAVATISGSTVTIVGGGTTTIIATQAATATYASNSIIAATFTVLILPTLYFEVTSRAVSDAPFTLSPPESNSAGAFTYSSSNPAVATVSGSAVTIVDIGTTTITATQAATATHLSNSITATFTVLLLPPPPPISLDGGIIKYTGNRLDVPTSSALFIQADPRGTGSEWFAVVKDGMKAAITAYTAGTNAPFIPSGQSVPVPFNNIVTTLMTDLSSTFKDRTSFNQPIGSWDTAKVTSMTDMFYSAIAFNQPIGSWNTSKVTTMSNMFYNLNTASIYSFNQDIGSWNTANVTDMYRMFRAANQFNNGGSPSISSWNTSNVVNMLGIFARSSAFNQPIGSWNTANVTDMSNVFQNATVFNQPIDSWNTANVYTMSQMFYEINFNQPIGSWNTANVTNMSGMFSSATAFNQPIDSWNTAKVTTMSYMFYNVRSFNQPIASWITSKVTTMANMFQSATIFNQPIGSWNTANVTTMASMFQSATIFNQPIGSWNTAKVTAFSNFRTASALSTENTPPKFR